MQSRKLRVLGLKLCRGKTNYKIIVYDHEKGSYIGKKKFTQDKGSFVSIHQGLFI